MLALVVALTTARARGQEPVAEPAGQSMQLEVIVNGSPTQLIGSFQRFDDGRIAARRQELEEIGLNPRGYASPDQLVVLNDLVGLSYKYEEATQRLLITAPDELLRTKEYDARGRTEMARPTQTDWGAVLNYNLFSSGSSSADIRAFSFSGASATFDARFFTPYGTVSQGAILRTSSGDRVEALRLNSTITYSNFDTMTTYRAGDTINGGLAWTRPIRLGGLQAQRNFGLRPDLVTLPLPSARGSAAVPSTADVYINNVKTYSQEINAGPFMLTNLPAVTGSGTARVVLRDAAGHVTESNLPFFVSSNLLAPGMFDFSVEAGLPRLSFGSAEDRYIAKPLGSASVRYGMFDWLTLAGHVEGGAGLYNGSAGAVARTGSFGVGTAAIAASYYGGGTGLQSYVSYETRLLGVSVSASSQMTFGPYDDLASVTARLSESSSRNPFDVSSYLDFTSSVTASAASLFTNARPPKAMNRVSFGTPLPFRRANLSASFIQTIDAAGVRSDIVSGTLSFSIGEMAAFASAFTTVDGKKNTGFLVGLSRPLGKSVTASVSGSGGTGGSNISVEATKPLDLKPGSYGWRVRDTEGAAEQRAAAASYRSSFGRMEAGASQSPRGVIGTAEFDGAVATMGGGVFFANRIDDAFAVVETGMPGIDVYHENRLVGVTNSSGRMLVPGLRSYQSNKIAIDTTNLPVDADIESSVTRSIPADRAGVKVKFGVQTNIRPAVVVFKGADGQPLAAGAQGQVEGGEAFVVGYDGRAYIKNLGAENKVSVTTIAGQCQATFAYQARANEQVTIPDVTCR